MNDDQKLAIEPSVANPMLNSDRKLSWWRRRWVRRLLLVAVAVGILVVLHRPMLRGMARFLIVDEPVGKADFLVLLPGSADSGAAIDDAARRYAAGDVRGILFFEPPMSRAVYCRAWPGRATALRGDLIQHGVPPSAIVVPPEPCRTTWDAAHALQHWLQNRPETRLILVDRLLQGRDDRRIIDSVLDARQTAGLQFIAMRGGFDENNWWHSREGIQLVFQNYAALVFDWWNGESEQCKGAWTLEEFENSLPSPKDN